jgi:hypothetical protein
MSDNPTKHKMNAKVVTLIPPINNYDYLSIKPSRIVSLIPLNIHLLI